MNSTALRVMIENRPTSLLVKTLELLELDRVIEGGPQTLAHSLILDVLAERHEEVLDALAVWELSLYDNRTQTQVALQMIAHHNLTASTDPDAD
jgi:hypothetical protein